MNNDFNQLLSEESANEGLSKEDLAMLERGKGDDVTDKLNALRLLKTRIASRLNNKNTPQEEKKTLRDRLAALNDLEKYVSRKKSEVDKAIEDATPSQVDASFDGLSKKVVDNNGNEFTINPDKTKRSNKDQFIYTLTDKEGNETEVSGEDLSNYSISEETAADKKINDIDTKIANIEKARKEALNKLYTNNGKLNADDAFFNSAHQYSLDEFTKMVRDRFGENRFDDSSIKAKRKQSIKDYKDKADDINKKYDEQIKALNKAAKEVKDTETNTPTKSLKDVAIEHENAFKEQQYKMNLNDDERTSFESERDVRPLQESS